MLVSFDKKFIRLDQNHIVQGRQASPFLLYFWSCLINFISEDTNMVFSIYQSTVKTLNIGTPRPATVVVLNIKQFNFTMK